MAACRRTLNHTHTVQNHLELESISVNYGEVVALPPLSLSIRAGEFFSLLGPSGCGKSTTLNVIAGFILIGQGRVVLDGRDITALPPQKREIGVVFQSYALFPHMTAAENIAYGLKLRKLDKDDIARRVDEGLALVQLSGKAGRYPRQLSGGEQQRIAIARALAIRPRLLLLDEPLSNLDARLREDMRLELKRIQRSTGITTVFVTHDQAEAFGTADRIAVLEKGMIKQVGSPSEIYKRPASPFVARFIGRSNRLAGRYSRVGQCLEVNGCRFAVDLDPATDIVDATLYLRPEDIKFEPSDAAMNSFSGVVTSVVYGGSTVDYQIQTSIGVLEICRFADQDQYAVGASAKVYWSPSAGAILSSDKS